MKLGLAPLMSRAGLGGVFWGGFMGLVGLQAACLLMAGAVSQCSCILDWLAVCTSPFSALQQARQAGGPGELETSLSRVPLGV